MNEIAFDTIKEIKTFEKTQANLLEMITPYAEAYVEVYLEDYSFESVVGFNGVYPTCIGFRLSLREPDSWGRFEQNVELGNELLAVKPENLMAWVSENYKRLKLEHIEKEKNVAKNRLVALEKMRKVYEQ